MNDDEKAARNLWLAKMLDEDQTEGYWISPCVDCAVEFPVANKSEPCGRCETRDDMVPNWTAQNVLRLCYGLLRRPDVIPGNIRFRSEFVGACMSSLADGVTTPEQFLDYLLSYTAELLGYEADEEK